MKTDYSIDPSRSPHPVAYINLIRGKDQTGEFYRVASYHFDDSKISLEDEMSLDMEIEHRTCQLQQFGYRVVVNHFAK